MTWLMMQYNSSQKKKNLYSAKVCSEPLPNLETHVSALTSIPSTSELLLILQLFSKIRLPPCSLPRHPWMVLGDPSSSDAQYTLNLHIMLSYNACFLVYDSTLCLPHPALSSLLTVFYLFIFNAHFILFFPSFDQTKRYVRSQFPNQGLNPLPLYWKHGILTTGPPGKCFYYFFHNTTF